MNEDQIREIMELSDPEGKVPQSIKEDLVNSLKNIETPKETVNKSEINEEDLKIQLSTEQDWRKRAAIAAKIISLGLE